MASAPVRDQLGDHLITPRNATLVLIDYQPPPIDHTSVSSWEDTDFVAAKPTQAKGDPA
jgi:hypothetical protein